MLGISESDHGDLKKVAERIMGMRISAALSDQTHPEDMQGMMSSLCQSLAAACVKHAELAFPSQDHFILKQKMATLGIFPAEDNAAQSAGKTRCITGGIPPPPGLATPTAPIPSEPDLWKASADVMYAVPRQQILWLTDKLSVHPTKVRGVKVWLDESGSRWIYLKEADAQKIIQWYDRAALFAVLKGATIDPVTGHPQDYRFEGGTCLTVWSTIAPGAPLLREACVMYMPRGRSR
jgi:hypothetical protein